MVDAHSHYLEELVMNLSKIDEDMNNVSWIIKEGLWLQDNSKQQRKLCDLIVVYQNNYAMPIELKGSNRKRYKAIVQLLAGKEFIIEKLNIQCMDYGKFVIYNAGKYTYEQIHFDRIIERK